MFWEDNELRRLGEFVIKKYPELSHINDDQCRIAYQYCDKAKKSNGMAVYADTECVKEKLKQFIQYDFIVTFYSGNTEALDDERLEKLMYHELSHVGFDYSEQGEARFKVIPHDVEDFRSVIDKWGLDWINDKTGKGGQGTGKGN